MNELMTTEQSKHNKSKELTELSSPDAFWDDIQLTPVKTSESADSKPLGVFSPMMENTHLSGVRENIATAFKELDDSFIYLGVLKKLSLPEATRFFEEKFFSLLKLFEKVWDNETYPEKEQVFSIAGEDFSVLNQLIHSGDAIAPIYEGLKTVYVNVERLRDSGMNRVDSMSTLTSLFQNRK